MLLLVIDADLDQVINFSFIFKILRKQAIQRLVHIGSVSKYVLA